MAIEKKSYTETEHDKVVAQLNALAANLRQYDFKEGTKEELTKSLSAIASLLVFEAI